MRYSILGQSSNWVAFRTFLLISKIVILWLLLVIKSCFIRSRQGQLSAFRPNFWTCLDKTTFDRMRKTRHVVVKCLHGLLWNWIFRGWSLFSWIGNFFRLPQGVVDIPGSGTWHLLRFDGIIVLWKVLETGFLLPYIKTRIYPIKSTIGGRNLKSTLRTKEYEKIVGDLD